MKSQDHLANDCTNMKATFTMDVLYNMDAMDAWIGHGCIAVVLT